MNLVAALDPLTLNEKLQLEGWLSGYHNSAFAHAALARLEAAWYGEHSTNSADPALVRAVLGSTRAEADAFVAWLRLGPTVAITGTMLARRALAHDFEMAFGAAMAQVEQLDADLDGRDPHAEGERIMREIDRAVEDAEGPQD